MSARQPALYFFPDGMTAERKKRVPKDAPFFWTDQAAAWMEENTAPQTSSAFSSEAGVQVTSST